MFARFEKRPAFCSYSVRCIDWKGTSGQRDGWLASGNEKGLVGLTYTTEEKAATSFDDHGDEETPRPVLPARTNFNLREHTKDVAFALASLHLVRGLLAHRSLFVGHAGAMEQITATP